MNRVSRVAVAFLVVLSATVAFAAAVPAVRLHLQAGSFDPVVDRAPVLPNEDRLPAAASQLGLGNTRYLLVQFSGPVRRDWQTAITETGAKVVGYVPDFALIVRATAAQESAVEGLPSIHWTGALKPSWRVEPGILGRLRSPAATGVQWTVVVHDGEEAADVAATVHRRLPAVRIFREAKGKFSVAASPADTIPLLQTIADHESVAWVEPYIPFTLSNNHSVWVGQSLDKTNGPTEAGALPSGYPSSATIWKWGIMGQGQIVAEGDSGLADAMCFFRTAPPHQAVAAPGAITVDLARRKVIAYNVLPGADDGDNSGCSYHGTHVGGSVLGDNDANVAGTATNHHDTGDGMAPQAKLIMQDVGGGGTACNLNGIPADLNDFFKQAYDAGARIHTNSWGADTAGAYNSNDRDLDNFMFFNENLLILFAASNAGPNAGTTGSPGNAKNGVTVAATSNGAAANRAENITNFSSVGPTDDGRLKPDIAAPGKTIISADGGTACATQTMSGTSMATPTMAGLSALARQYFTEGWYPTGTKVAGNAFTPTAAAQKTVLLAGAKFMTGCQESSTGGCGGRPAVPGAPNNMEGWGRARLNETVWIDEGGSASAEPFNKKIKLWDVPMSSGIETGLVQEYALEVGNAQRLHIRLGWSDAPPSMTAAKQLVNDLNLEVIGPTGTVYHGNQWNANVNSVDRESAPGAAAWDNTNNVEGVNILSPAAGNYLIRVRGLNVPGYQGKYWQGYAVAVNGDLTNTCSLAAPGGVSAIVAGPNQVNLSWSAVAGGTRYAIYRSAPGGTGCTGGMQQIAQTDGLSYIDYTAQGGFSYAYHVKTVRPCDGPASACTVVTVPGNCTLKPTFSGLTTAANAATASCAIDLSWSAATSNCPAASGVKYNIYRGTTPDFLASAANRIATCIAETTFRDTGVVSGTTQYYVVRAEDGTSRNGGPCNNGNEETNNIIRYTTPYASGTGAAGTWTDGGGDTNALLNLAGTWSIVSNTDAAGYAQTGSFAYKTSPGTSFYPASACYAATTPTLTVGAANPVVTFWERHSLELDWDGVVVERSVNGGAWTVVAPGTTACFESSTATGNACAYAANTQGYENNAAGGAFTAYTSRSFTITAAVGDTVAVRWRLSSDGGVEQLGFLLDTISITNINLPNACTADPVPGDLAVLTATARNAENKLEWVAPSSGTALSLVLRFRTDGVTPTSPADGLEVTPAIAITAGAKASFTHTALTNGTSYRYRGFVQSGTLFSYGKVVVAQPVDTTLPIKWKFSSAATALNPPTINSAIYNVSNDRFLHSMNFTATGGDWPSAAPKAWVPLAMNAPSQSWSPVWTTDVIAGVARIVVATAQDGRAYCVNADTGALLWTSAVLGDALQATPSAYFVAWDTSATKLTANMIFVATRNATADNVLVALNAVDGTTLWSFNNGGGAAAIGPVNGGIISYASLHRLWFASRKKVGASANTVWSLDYTDTGATLRWGADAGDVDGFPFRRGTTVYAGNNLGEVRAYDADVTTNPNPALWTFATSDGAVKSLILPDFATTKLYFSTMNRVWALDDTNGTQAGLANPWSTPASGAGSIATPSRPVKFGAFLYVGSGSGSIVKLDLATTPPGQTIIAVGSGAVGPPSADFGNSLLHAGTEAGIVYCIAP